MMPITKNGNSIIYFSGAPTPPNFAPTVPILISVRPIKSSNWEQNISVNPSLLELNFITISKEELSSIFSNRIGDVFLQRNKSSSNR